MLTAHLLCRRGEIDGKTRRIWGARGGPVCLWRGGGPGGALLCETELWLPASQFSVKQFLTPFPY